MAQRAEMDPMSVAEELPALYRELLDWVAQLEAAGKRSAGQRLRAEATRIYSRAWDERARHALEALLRHSAAADMPRQERMQGSQRRRAPVV